MAEAATGRFRTAAEVVCWVEETFAVVYTVSGITIAFALVGVLDGIGLL